MLVIVGIGVANFVSSSGSGPTVIVTSSPVYQIVKENLTVSGRAAEVPCSGFNLADCASFGNGTLHNVELISYGGAFYYLFTVVEPNGEGQNDSQPLPTSVYTVWFTNSTVYCISPAHPITNSLHQNPTCPTTPFRVSRVVVPVPLDSTLNSTYGLRLSLALSTNSSGAVSVAVDLFNTLNHTNMISAGNHWPVSVSNMFLWLQEGCGPPTDLPIGYEILQGNYSLGDFREGTPLWLEASPLIPGCPREIPTPYYTFRPLSDVATWSGSYASYDLAVETPCQFNPGSGCYWYGVGTWFGYWTGSTTQVGTGLWVQGGECPGQESSTSTQGTPFNCPLLFNRFPAGMYTVIAADEWGQVLLLHFVVTEVG